MASPPQIAIVDDDAAVREALFDLLQVEGLHARMFDAAANLLADPDLNVFECIVSDVRMADIDGLELLRRIKALGLTTPVILITSATDAATRRSASGGGAAAFFTKPVDDQALLAKLRELLGRRQNTPT